MPWVAPSGITYLFAWEDGSSGGTPLNAANLNNEEILFEDFMFAIGNSLSAYTDTSITPLTAKVAELVAQLAALGSDTPAYFSFAAAGHGTNSLAITTTTVTTGVNVAPVLSLNGDVISWAAQSAATGWLGAISTEPAGTAGRTTTYVSLGNVTSWTPPADAGVTLYYGLASEGSAGNVYASSEVSITWSGAPPAPTPTTVKTISVMNTTGWGADPVFSGIGVTHTRLDVGTGAAGTDGTGTEGNTFDLINLAQTHGMIPLPIYNRNSGLIGVTPAQCATDCLALANKLLALATPITVIEFGNEPWLVQGSTTPGSTAAVYAAQYHAAHVALAGKGITLLASMTNVAANNGAGSSTSTWPTDFIAALPSGVSEVDAWTIHPYGPMTGLSAGYGWQNATTLAAQLSAAGSTAKIWITECGQAIGGTDSNVTEAVQATDLTTYLNDVLTYSWCAYFNWYSCEDDGTGQFGLLNPAPEDEAPLASRDARPSFTALETWVAKNGSVINEGALIVPTVTFNPPNGSVLTAPASGGLGCTITFSVPMNTESTPPFLLDTTTGLKVGTLGWGNPATVCLIANDGYNFNYIPGHGYWLVAPSGLQTEAGYTLPNNLVSVFSVAAATGVPQRNLNIHAQFNTYPNGVLDETYVPAIVTSGAQAVRSDVVWADIQKSAPASSSYTSVLASVMANDPGETYSSGAIYLARFDYLMSQAVIHGFKVLLMVSATPAWACASSSNVEVDQFPASPSTYAAFVAFLATRYGPGAEAQTVNGVANVSVAGLEAIEVWNEPQGIGIDASLYGSTFQGVMNAYVPVLRAAYTAINAANPSVLVAGPALAGSVYDNTTDGGPKIAAYDALVAFYAATESPVGFYDVLTLHMYGDPPSHTPTPHATPAQMVADWVSFFGPTIAANDPNIPVWCTEMGWNTGPDGVTAAAQATDLTASVEAFQALGGNYERIYWYSLVDQGSGTASSDDGNNYGLYTTAWVAQPSLAAFQAIASGSAPVTPTAPAPVLTFSPANGSNPPATSMGSGGTACTITSSVAMNPNSTSPYLLDTVTGDKVGMLTWVSPGYTSCLITDDGFGYDFVGDREYWLVAPIGLETAAGYTLTSNQVSVFTTAASSSAIVTGLVKGIAAGGTIQNTGGVLTTTQQMNMIGVTLGASWVRFDCNEDQYNAYGWTYFDAAVADAQAAGLSVLMMVGEPSTSAPFSGFQTFFASAVSRYYPMGVTAFEVMNEVNSAANWGGTASGAQYATLLKACYQAGKLAEPDCIIISAGLSPNTTGSGNFAPCDFLTAMYAGGAQGYFDALGHHPYAQPAQAGVYETWSAWSQMNDTTPSLRSIMTANGDGAKPIWATETGAFTGTSTNADTQAQQASDISAILTQWEAVTYPKGPVFIYNHFDSANVPSNQYDNWGLYEYDGVTAKTAAATFKAAASSGPTLTLSGMAVTVSGTTATVSVNCSSDLVNVTFQDNGGAITNVTPSGGVASHAYAGLAAGSSNAFSCVGYNVPAGNPNNVANVGVTATATASVTIAGSSMRVTTENSSQKNYSPYLNVRADCLAAGMTADRIDIASPSSSDFGWTLVSQAQAAGFSGLIVAYVPAQSTAPSNSDLVSIATQLAALTVPIYEILFLNEPYYRSDGNQYANTYGASYASAKKALITAGLTSTKLVAAIEGDWEDASGTWHDDAAGNGWIATVIGQVTSAGLTASQIDGFDCHPYPLNASTGGASVNVAGIASGDVGWPCVGRFQQIAAGLGFTGHWYITEFGAVTDNSTSGNTYQASAITTMMDCFSETVTAVDSALSAAGWTCRTPFTKPTYIATYASVDDGTGDWGMINETGTERPAFSALAAFS